MPSFRSFLSQQLGFPTGWFGRLLLLLLNRHNAAMNDLVLQALAPQPGDRILEIGFGGGDLIHKLLGTRLPALVVGLERSSDALAVCHRRFHQAIQHGQVELQLADAAALPYADRQFHQLCTVNTLYFWPDARRVCAEGYRVLKPGGKFVIGYATKAYLDQQSFSRYGFTTYEVAEVEQLLSEAGFSAITTQTQVDRHHDICCTTGRVPPHT